MGDRLGQNRGGVVPRTYARDATAANMHGVASYNAFKTRAAKMFVPWSACSESGGGGVGRFTFSASRTLAALRAGLSMELRSASMRP